MGDRTTPMKFGPEWLRNLSREPTSSGSQASGGGAQSSTPASRAANLAATATATTNNPPNTSKVLLAKLRYGREEILALYDRQTAEAPQQLKSVELLYHPRGKPPYALNNNFEDDTRDMRNNPAMGGMGPTDRYGLARGRGMSLGEGRGRATISEGRSRGRGFVRQTSLGSDTFRTPSWHNGGQRTYPGAPEDDPNPSRGLWNTGNGSNLLPIRANMEVAEWASKMAYRKNRQNHTNWRQQQNRDEGEEWRSSEGQRRGQEKWEREWPERSNQDKPWTSNRRQWGGDNNDDALPEWAVENSEACAGTFDSSGAFHGYSIDDSDLPKTQESYPLARSHTHGGVPRSRTAEEGSEEWWASEKAKKLSAKRFDATKVKFKLSNEENDGGNATSATNTGANTNTVPTRNESKAEIIRSAIHEDPTHDYGFELQDEAAALPVKPKQEHEEDKPKDRKYHGNTQPSAQQRIDMLLRADKPDTTTERKDHTSVMMAINTNRLRLRHQNIGSPTNEPTKKKSVLEMMVEQQRIKESQQRQQEKESKLVDDMLDMHISEELQSQLLNSTTQAATMVNPVTSMANKLSSPVMKMRMSNPSNQAMGVKQQKTNTMSTPGHQQGTMMRPILGISNSMLNASLGLPVGPSSNISMPPPLIQNPGMLSSSHQGVGGGNMQGSLQGMQTGLTGNMQVGGLQTGLQVPGIQGNSFKPGGGIPGNMQPNIQSSGIHNSNFQSGSGMPGSRMAGSGMAGSGMAGSGMPGSGIPGSGMPGSGMLGSVMSASGMPGFQGNNSLFMQGASNNMQNPNDMSNHGQQNMYQMHGHGMQQPQPQSSFNRTTIFSNMMQPVPNGFIPNIPLMDQWFYEDPKKNIQGPFTTNEMNCWYRAGFFNSELMVRRACESNLRPLATYGPMPFGAPLQEAMTPAYTIRFYPPATPLGMGNTQQAGLGPDVESLWSQPTTNDLMWLQQRSTSREDDNSRVNNLSMYFWDQGRM